MAEGLDTGRVDDAARRLWWAALETIQAELLPVGNHTPPRGVWIAAPYLRFTTPTCSLDSRDGFGPRINSAEHGWASALLPPDRLHRADQSSTTSSPLSTPVPAGRRWP